MPEATDLHRLVALEEIRTLVGRYARTLDERRYDEWVACFHPAALLNYSWGTVEGTAGLRDRVAEVLAPFARGQHMIANLAVEVAGDTARGQADYFVTMVRERDDGSTKLFHDGGIYQHEYVRTEQGWRIQRLDCVSTWQSISWGQQ